MPGILLDVRHALRTFRNAPITITAAILSIGLGIGANTAIFSVIDALMLRALPIANPDEMVRIVNPNAPDFGFPPLHYEHLRQLNQQFSGVAAVYNSQRANVEVNRAPETRPLEVGLISDNYFDLLGIRLAIGRTFARTEPAPVAMITYGYWERRFGLDPRVLGGTVAINGTIFGIVGVTARGFTGDQVGKPVDVWLPLKMQSAVVLENPQHEAPWLRVLARLRTGIPQAQAQAAAQAAYITAVRDTPGLRPRIREDMLRRRVEVASAARGFMPQRGTLMQPLTISGAIVGLALLIACANVANLLLAKSAVRQREIDTRLALGASRMRIGQQLLTESFLLSVAGGITGLFWAIWAARVLATFAGSGLNPVMLDIHLDARLLAFSFALTLLTGVIFGVTPAWLAATGGVVRHRRANVAPWISSGQVALAVTLLAAAGAFTSTLRNLRAQDLGFDRDRVLLVWTAPEQTGHSGKSVAALFKNVPARIASVPGVLSASASMIGPLEGTYAEAGRGASPNIVAPGFFETVGMRILAGRDFNDHDTESSNAVGIVNVAFARELFGNENPIGRSFEFRRSSVEIIGVVSDTKFNTARENKRRMFFIPYTQDSDHLFSMCVVARITGNSPGLTSRIRDEVRSAVSGLPVSKIDLLSEQLDQSLLFERLTAALATAFAMLAGGLACIGVYGVVAFSVARRTNEIGVRVALGATRADIMTMVLRQSMIIGAVGIAAGIPLSIALLRLSQTMLFGMRSDDPPIICAAALLMLIVAAIAGLLPARKAASSEPVVALRHE